MSDYKGSIRRIESGQRSRHFHGGFSAEELRSFERGDAGCLVPQYYLEKTFRLEAGSRAPATSTGLEQVKLVKTVYSLGEGVEQFLLNHSFVCQALQQAVDEVRKAFPDNKKLSTELLIEGSEQKLFVLIHTKKGADMAIESLSAFDESWWFKIPGQIRRFMEFSIEFE